MKILVITEQRDGKWNPVSSETLVAAQQIAAAQPGSRVAAVVIGKEVRGLAEEAAASQLAEVLLVEHDLLEQYLAEPHLRRGAGGSGRGRADQERHGRGAGPDVPDDQERGAGSLPEVRDRLGVRGVHPPPVRRA